MENIYNIYLPRFDKWKTKVQNNERYYEYVDICINTFLGLFDFEIDESIDIYPFIALTISEGVIGVSKDNTYGSIIWGGNFTKNGMNLPNSILTLDNKTIDGDIELFKLTPSAEPIITISRFSNLLSQVDISQEVLVKATRSKSVIVADTEKEKMAIDKVFEDLDDGTYKTIIKDNDIFREPTTGQNKKIELNDVTLFQSMQYLSSYHSELCRRLYGLMGFSMSQKDKQAQLTTNEVDDRQLPSLIYPTIMLSTMNECFNKINAKFGYNWSVKPSKILQKALDTLDTQEAIKENGVDHNDKNIEPGSTNN